MKGTTKVLLGVIAFICILLLAVWLFLGKKTKDSRALSQYIPPSEYVARINTKKALKLAYSLKNDSLSFHSESKWRALFGDSTKTGVDFLVNPWIFGDSSNLNIAFQLRSQSNFAKWMNQVADTALLLDGFEAFPVKENGITFFTNGSKVAMASMGSLPAAIETGESFFSGVNKTTKGLEFGDELIQVKLSKPFSYGELIEIKDTFLKLNITEEGIMINSSNSIEIEGTLSAGFFLTQEKWNKLRTSSGSSEVLKILGLHELELEEETPYLNLLVKDTFHMISKSYSFEFDDNFNKVQVEKVSTKILPNISVSFAFNDVLELEAFIARNSLTSFKHDFLQMYTVDNVLMFSMKKIELNQMHVEHLVVHTEKIREVLSYNEQFQGVKLDMLQGVRELIYVNEPNKGSYLKLDTEKHPIIWLIERHNSRSEK
jgi:hypothetical protein